MEQHTEGRLHDSQAMLDLETVVCKVVVSAFTCRRHGEYLPEGRIEIVSRQNESCGTTSEHGMFCCCFLWGSETSVITLEASARAVCVMLAFHFDVDSCSDGRTLLWLAGVCDCFRVKWCSVLLHSERVRIQVVRQVFSQPLEWEERQTVLHQRAGDDWGWHGVPWQQISHKVTTRGNE